MREESVVLGGEDIDGLLETRRCSENPVGRGFVLY